MFKFVLVLSNNFNNIKYSIHILKIHDKLKLMSLKYMNFLNKYVNIYNLLPS